MCVRERERQGIRTQTADGEVVPVLDLGPLSLLCLVPFRLFACIMSLDTVSLSLHLSCEPKINIFQGAKTRNRERERGMGQDFLKRRTRRRGISSKQQLQTHGFGDFVEEPKTFLFPIPRRKVSPGMRMAKYTAGLWRKCQVW